jgi:tRNA(His) 5'-end guanylyltransferase
MKEYESVPRAHLTKRLPAIIRLDGKAFHTLTRKLEKPVDTRFMKVMAETAKAVAEEVQGCKLGYTQSDEISLLLTDYETIKTQGWFDYGIQKMVSVSASLATAFFNARYLYHFGACSPSLAVFDSRVFTLPPDEVTNYFLWRQQDAIRNSIQSFGQYNIGKKETHGVNCKDMLGMLKTRGIDWAIQPLDVRQGTLIQRVQHLSHDRKGEARQIKVWESRGAPDFKTNRDLIDDIVHPAPPETCLPIPWG